ncbi:MAG: hypothetical protein HYS07_08905 [Chlamydiae bacterium]|nr:hypothetical protein [Chlamydiota bacterium]MBI3277017.1 hypothetical protein [Chlamydiota bacterium]
MKTKWFIIPTLSMALSVVRLTSAALEHEHKEGEGEIPATLSGIWAEVKEHEEELGKIIADKKLDKVHEVAFEIRDRVNALPDKSMDLASDKLAKVKSNAKFVANLAKRLDDSGDAGDQVATEANFKKLQGLLKTIEAQYPAGVLSQAKGMIYTCPMHPEVKQDKPGSCPKCGMTLKTGEDASHDEMNEKAQ